MSETVGLVLLAVIYSGVIGGLPYAVLAAGLFFWMRNKTEPQIRRALALSPLILAGMFVYIGLVSVLIFNQGSFEPAKAKLAASTFLIGCVLVFGYAYVLLAFGLVRLFGKSEKT